MYRLVKENTKSTLYRSNSDKSLYSTTDSHHHSTTKDLPGVPTTWALTSISSSSSGSRTRRSSTGNNNNKNNSPGNSPGNSPPRLPYDELQTDQRRQQQLRMRSKYIEGNTSRSHSLSLSPVSPQRQRRQLEPPPDMSMDSSSNHTVNSRGSCSSNSSAGTSSTATPKSLALQAYSYLQQQQQDTPAPSSHRQATPSSSQRPPIDRRTRRKSKPWETDVKMNRFGNSSGSVGSVGPSAAGRGSSSTQKSTLGWKQRMQERKAVFGNVAVPEQSFDEDDQSHLEDNDDDDDDDEESRGEGDADAIRKEAMQLLKSRGFSGSFQGIPSSHLDDDDDDEPLGGLNSSFQGILQQHYDDDLESVGGSVFSGRRSPSSPSFLSPFASPPPRQGGPQQTVCLDEIKSLREKILHQMDKSAETNNNRDDDENEPFDQQRNSSLQTPKMNQSSQSLRPHIDSRRHQAAETMAPEDNVDAIKAWKVMKQLKVRLNDVFTDDHFIIEAMGRKGTGSPSSTPVVIDEKAFDRYRLRDAVEKRVSLVFTGDHHIVCNGQVQRRELDDDSDSLSGCPAEEKDAGFDDDDEGETKIEFEDGELPDVKSPKLRERLSDSFMVFESLLRARQEANMNDDWTVCSASVAPPPSARNAPGMIPSVATPNNNDDADGDDQSCWTEYTLETTTPEKDDGRRRETFCTVQASNSSAQKKEYSGCQKDLPATVKKSNMQKDHVADSSNEWDDDSFDECTVEEKSAAMAPFRFPGQAQLPVQTLRHGSDDQESYTEFTVQGRQQFSAQTSEADDTSYMEMTIADEIETPPTRQPPQRRPQGDFREMASPDLTSPHMTSMLSSRMFADMELPNELRQQQQYEEEDNNDDSYPTITLGQVDDDDMTQITFDHTMVDDGSPSQDHHHFATQYLDNSSKSKDSYRTMTTSGNVDAPDLPSIVGSQHTEQTRDTTVSDDVSSTQGDSSFRSCASTESSQFVAELLRRDIWSPDASVVQSALEKLKEEASKGFHERSNIVRYGGLLAILRAMDMTPGHAGIQKAACAALEKMANDAGTQVAIGEVGGIPAIAHAMKEHADDLSLQHVACRALAALTRHRDENDNGSLSRKPVQAEGVVAAVTKSMTRHPDDPDIQANSFGALANLCLDSQVRLRELKQSGGLAAMTMALHVSWANKTDQHEAISTLSILLRSLTDLDQS